MSPAPDPASRPRAGDHPIKEVYLAHVQAVRRHAARAALGNDEAAEDATQEAFLEAFRKWSRFRQLPPGEQLRWLCGRARWRVIDSWRATSAEHPADTVLDQPDPRADEDTILAVITADRFWKIITTAVPLRAARAAYLR